MKNKLDLFVDVLPLIHLPRMSSQVYTYKASYSPGITIGQLVEVPLRNSTPLGIIIDVKQKCSIPRVKKIKKIISREALFTKNQLMLARRLSEYYCAPLTLFVKSFLSQKLTMTKNIPRSKYIQRQNKKSIVTLRTKSFELLFNVNSKDQLKQLAHKMKYHLKSGEQTLCLFPTMHQLYHGHKILKQLISEDNILLFHSALNARNYSENYLKVKSKTGLIVCATRVGCFLPFANLGLIIMTDSNNTVYKQWDQKPLYHTKKVVEFLTAIHKTNTVYTTVWPSINDWYEINHKKIKLLNKPDFKRLQYKKYYPIIFMKLFYFIFYTFSKKMGAVSRRFH